MRLEDKPGLTPVPAEVVVSNLRTRVDYDIFGTPTGRHDVIFGERTRVVQGETVVYQKDIYPMFTGALPQYIPRVFTPVRQAITERVATMIANIINHKAGIPQTSSK